jgi:hypothetical protein
MDRALENFYNELQMKLPGATMPMVQMEFRNTLRQFFQETNAWVEDVEFVAHPNTVSYDVIPEGQAKAVRLMGVFNPDLPRLSNGDSDRPSEFTFGALGSSPVNGAMMNDLEQVTIPYGPTAPQTYIARVAMTVNQDVDPEGNPFFPRWVLDRYNETLVDGTLARMHAQSAKPYSNPQMAAFYFRKFTGGLAAARNYISKANIYGGQRWRFPRFARR